MKNNDTHVHLYRGIAIGLAIVVVIYMVHTSDLKKKKDRPSYRHTVHLIEDNIAGF
jgi:hypothetical protein